MKKFSYRLEPLLRYRSNLEEIERNELFRLAADLRRELDQLRKLQGKNHDTVVELAKKKMENTDQPEIGWFYAYLDRLRHEMQQIRKSIARLEAQIEKQKLAVIEASKRRKILDALKTKKEKEFLARVEKEEQKSVDEIVVIRFPHKTR